MPSVISHDNLRHAVDLIFFEQWLRFYFITEEKGKLFIRMPDCELDKARELYPQLVAVAEALNNRELNHSAAMEALREGMLSGPFALNGEQWAEILAGKNFRLTMELMSFWVQSDEDAPEVEAISFEAWKQSFEKWRSKPAIKEYSARIMHGDAPTERMQ